MSNIFVDGFGTYGTGTSTAIEQAMLSGVWSSLNGAAIGTLPWDASNPDLYYSSTAGAGLARVALPATTDPCRASFYYALSSLPADNISQQVMLFGDSTNTTICMLVIYTTGVVAVLNNSLSVLAVSGSPVVVAQSAQHWEVELNRDVGTLNLYINQTQVLNATGLTFTGSGGTAQVSFNAWHSGSSGSQVAYVSHIILRNSSGSYNNSFPIGDRKVSTLFANSDSATINGWTAEPRKLYAAGLVDNRANDNSGVTAASSTSLDLGSGDFTIEGFFRFNALPTGSYFAQLFGKWDATNNKRSYQLYVGGPSLGAGNTVFQTSTDGTAGTVAQVFSFPYAYQIDQWYHIAVVRASSLTYFFVNGVQQGLPVSDSRTYYVGTETAALGVENDSGTWIANTAFNGFLGQFRLSVGFARYTANFAEPSAEFGIGIGNDPNWSSVQWVSNWDSGINDQSAAARTLTPGNGAAFITPTDGSYQYQVINKATPADDTFIQAALVAATATLTQSALPTNTDTCTVATKDGTAAAVYTWKTTLSGSAFEVLIGASAAASLSNLAAAINNSGGAGTIYGTGTTANNDVSASGLPGTQMLVTALVPGTGGNSLACSTNDPNGSWSGSTLAGGAAIPSASQFSMQTLPRATTVVDSITIRHRDFKTDSGAGTIQASLVGGGGGVAAGAANNVTTTPTVYADTIEQDPDTSGGVTTTTVTNGWLNLNRTA